MAKHFIDDGYNQPAYIKEEAGLHGELRFTFRPMIVSERAKFFRDLDKLQDDEQIRFTAKTMAKRLLSWDLKEKPEPSVLLRLQPRLYDRIFAIIIGTSAGDADPNAGEGETPVATSLMEEPDAKN